MTYDTTLERLARNTFEAEMRRTMAQDRRLHHHDALEEADVATAVAVQRCCISTWLLRDLLTLVRSSPERPVAELMDEIRQHIVDRSFHDECGDPAAAHDHQTLLNQQVEAIVKALEVVRRQAIEQGLWSKMTLGPEMFG